MACNCDFELISFSQFYQYLKNLEKRKIICAIFQFSANSYRATFRIPWTLLASRFEQWAFVFSKNTPFTQFRSFQLWKVQLHTVVSVYSVPERKLSRPELHQNLENSVLLWLNFWSNAQRAVVRRKIFVSRVPKMKLASEYCEKVLKIQTIN